MPLNLCETPGDIAGERVPSAPRITSRERVLRALHHQETDRPPIDLGSMGSTGIMAIAYARLREHLGICHRTIRICDMPQQLAEVEPEVMSRFGVDVISLGNSMGDEQSGLWKPWRLPNGVPCEVPAGLDVRQDEEAGGWMIWEGGVPTQRMSPGSLYFSECYHPLAEMTSPDELRLFPRPVLRDEELRILQQRASRLHETTDLAIMANFGGNVLEAGNSLRGFARFMMDLAEGGGLVEDLLGGIVETQLSNLKLYLQAVGQYVQIIQFGDDLGMQDRPLMSTSMYRKYLMPGHQTLYQYVHRNSSCAVFLHSCGAIYPLIPDLITAGVDILNPVQTSAKDMEPGRLKQEFGHVLTFWGGVCDTQSMLPGGTPDQVAQHVRERVAILSPGGGFVFNPVHNIQADVPPENIVALFDVALSRSDAV